MAAVQCPCDEIAADFVMAIPPDPGLGDDAENSDKTIQVEDACVSALVHANAGRLLGQMLDASLPEGEHEGDLIGPYCLCELLGEGGFGSVWRAEQTMVVKREVAVKVIKLGMDTAQVLGRFNQERQALASLDHPNIAKMLDAGSSPDGRPYFAMELVRGGPITKWCETHQLPLRERLGLFVPVCQAVQHAHEKGILHRDLKPGNILVTEGTGQPVPKIIDFGIAKAMHVNSLDDLTMLTQADQTIGTPLYMAPEQIEGGREPDARCDVYALGVLLYELLTGQPPFDVKLLAADGMQAMKRLLIERIPERPSIQMRRKIASPSPGKMRVDSIRYALPADLDWITMRALEKDRQRRYQTVAELVADVQRHLDNKPVVARPPSIAYAARRWVKRHRTLSIAVCAALVSGLGAAFWTHWSRPELLPLGSGPLKLATDGTHTNSLGMKFVPVPGTNLLFCIHETRYQDYAAYSAAVPGVNSEWTRYDDGFPTGSKVIKFSPPTTIDHPVMSVSWDDAQKFCLWLSGKEGRMVRLPTDEEWNIAAGVPPEVIGTPEEFNLYPWGGSFPPKTEDRVGNYADLTYHELFPGKPWIEGYNDGFATTAPVMSFKPNAFGLYDMGGNVDEWCLGWINSAKTKLVYRGGAYSWASNLHSTSKGGDVPGGRRGGTGFRCVIEWIPPAAKKEAKEVPAAQSPVRPPPAVVAQPSETNSLGMKFVPVPGTDVLFCIHETRNQDYAAFATDVPDMDDKWRFSVTSDPSAGTRDDFPVVMVSWEDAQKFCAWLSKKEGRVFRLPTDQEWSFAVGLGDEGRTPSSTPVELKDKLNNVYPWGGPFPPTAPDSGNYADASFRALNPKGKWIEGYDDGYAALAPVMRFKPNPYGLYDMGGNVEELCQDVYDRTGNIRVARGGFYSSASTGELLLRSSNRDSRPQNTRFNATGFRVVMEVGDGREKKSF